MKNFIKTKYSLFLLTALMLNACKKDQSVTPEIVKPSAVASLPDKFQLSDFGLNVVTTNGVHYLQYNNSSVAISETNYVKLAEVVSEHKLANTKLSVQNNRIQGVNTPIGSASTAPTDAIALDPYGIGAIIQLIEKIAVDGPQYAGPTFNLPLKISPELADSVTQTQVTIPVAGAELKGIIYEKNNKAKVKSKGLLFILHGLNTSASQKQAIMERYLKELGYNVFMIDYRSYGASTGSYDNKEQIFADISIVYNNYVLKKYDSKKVIIMGHSLGTGIAAQLVSSITSKDKQPSGLILFAPYYDLYTAGCLAVASAFTPDQTYHDGAEFILASILSVQGSSVQQYMKFNITTSKYIKNFSLPVPVHIMQGLVDRLVVPQNSTLIQVDNPNVTVQFVPGIGHSDIYEYWNYMPAKDVVTFLNKFTAN
ncbi:alpha/beta hydrolase [Pedobacter nototheniae]|uniref:alpha/beta hydrolase n=1 Tax=Pedobacter nototheniae TaxID=2488994 RepID=UPI00103F390F|nr:MULTISPECIES: alpha/beta fold hydrolase [Pedobacter]